MLAAYPNMSLACTDRDAETRRAPDDDTTALADPT
jgi:hypothetical protein